MNEIDTIIFDIGGVLVQQGQRADIFGHYGIPRPRKDHESWQGYKLGRINELEYWTRALQGTPLADRAPEVLTYAQGVYANAAPGDALALVRPLKDAGYRLAILSNHVSSWARPFLARHGLHELCDAILVSSEIQLAKPDPAIYAYTLRVVQRERTPERCVFIDDKIENITGARNAGMQAIHYAKDTGLESELRALGVQWQR